MTLFRNKYRIESARLDGWDYSSNGQYFITLCTQNHSEYFGRVENEKTILSPIGEIVKGFYSEIPDHFSNILLDEYVIMPDHIHGIIIINNGRDDAVRSGRFCRSRRDVALQRLYGTERTENTGPDENGDNNSMSRISPKPGSLSVVIRSFKSICTRTINERFPQIRFQWQSRYYDHIIRDEKSLEQIRWYIRNNPKKWEMACCGQK